jgi:hypothetical protein
MPKGRKVTRVNESLPLPDSRSEGAFNQENTGKMRLVACYLGADPELFIEDPKSGIVGSERAIPEKGLGAYLDYPNHPKIIRDGVQVELNVSASHCRAGLAMNFAQLFKQLKEQLVAKGLKANFNTVVDVPKAEMEALSAAARRLGCAPSLNDTDAKATITEADAESTVRSAGGHVHLGLTSAGFYGISPIGVEWNYKRLVRVLDLILGNTCVMIDRDPRADERRKVYGRAGEYRLPNHGLEYRTLSNFWLRSWPLASMVFALARLGVTIEYYKLSDELLSLVKPSDVVKAINTNDLDLARANFDAIKPFIAKHFVETKKEISIYSDVWPLTAEKLKDFDFFVSKPVEYWFPDDPMVYWTEKYKTSGERGGKGREVWDDGHVNGWESFLVLTVRPQRLGAALMESGGIPSSDNKNLQSIVAS